MDGVLVAAGSLWSSPSPHSLDSDGSSPTPSPPPLKRRKTHSDFFSVLEVHEVTQLLFPAHFGGHFGMGVVFIEIAPHFLGCFPMMMGHQGKKINK